MKVAVTGGAGVVGAPLCRDLARDHAVVSIDLRDADVIADVQDLASLRAAFAGCDAIVHLAGIARFDCTMQETLGPNLAGTMNAYEAARLAGCRRFVFAGSHHVVGMNEIERAPGLYSPGSGLVLRSDSDLRPDSLYAAWKVFGEALGRVYQERHGLLVACIRIGTMHAANDPRDRSVLQTSGFLGLTDADKFRRYAATWMSHRDFADLVRAILASAVPFAVVYGVSDNATRFYDLEAGRSLFGFWPKDGVR
jgi:nucleoside-diphosphate-sugar epimerase